MLIYFVLILPLCRAQFLPIDWELASPTAAEEANIRFPARFVPFDACTCDRRRGACDAFCCCDADCPRSLRRRDFGCAEEKMALKEAGLAKEEIRQCHLPPLTNEHCLIHFHFNHTVHWTRCLVRFSSLCIRSEHSAHLGDFFPNTPIARDRLHHATALFRRRPLLSLDGRREIDHFQAVTSEASREVPSSYVAGSLIRLSKGGGVLGLPAAGLDGAACSPRSPAQFLVPRSEECVSRVSETTCVSWPLLDVHSFATPLVQPRESRPAGKPFEIIAELRSGDALSRISSFRYLCQETTSSVEASKVDPTAEILFPTMEEMTARAGPKTPPPICLFATPLQQVPDQPTLRNDSNGRLVCDNVVKSVKYSFTWFSEIEQDSNLTTARIYSMQGEVMVGSVPADGRLIVQKFGITWRERAPATPVPDTRSVKLPRSGNPGYDRGRAVITATSDNVESKDIQTGPLDQLFVYTPDVSGLCNNSVRSPVLFGVDSDSLCHIQLPKEAFADCPRLGTEVDIGLIEQFFPQLISRNGIPMGREDFIRIVRENVTVDEEETVQPPLIDSNVGPSATLAPDGNETTTTMTTTTSVPIRLSSNFECMGIPHHIGLEIYWAEVGVVKGVPVLEIVGAYTYFNMTVWRFPQEAVGRAQRFPVSTSVRFVQQFPVNPEPLIRFWTQPRREECPSNAVRCWDNIVFPIREVVAESAPGEYPYALASALALVLAALPFYRLTRPWAC